MDTDGTGLSQEQYSRLLRYFWPDVDLENCDAVEAAQAAALEELGSAEELHQLAWNYNWDDGVAVPNWIVAQPICDRGTALLLYWHASPRWYCQYASRDQMSEYEVNVYDLIKEIEGLYLSGFYTTQNISYDPTDDQTTDWTTEHAEYADCVPPAMKEPSPGRTLERAAF